MGMYIQGKSNCLLEQLYGCREGGYQRLTLSQFSYASALHVNLMKCKTFDRE